jgi:uncharacterized protein YecE (DUF72 family)
MSGRAFVGTSGFAYKEWKGGFYPERLKPADMLGSYSSRLTAVEINYTFNRFPTETLLAGWAAKTPAEFSFALKAPRRITHELRFASPVEPVERFVTAARTLRSRLGPILFQTPPNFAADPARLEGLLAALPGDVRAAFEFRHPSWDSDEIRSMLAGSGAAWCAADTDGTPATVHRASSTHAYLRLRRDAYDDDELASWTAVISEMVADGLDVHCYFRHTDDGRGATYALALLERLREQGAEPVEDLAGRRELDGGEADLARPFDVDVKVVDESGTVG